MRITFFSNYFNSHQLPVALGLASLAGVDYTFVSLMQTDGLIGRSSLDYRYPFVLREYDNDKAKREAIEHVHADDLIVFGDMAGKNEYVHLRSEMKKPYLMYSERILKRGDWWRFVPPKTLRTWNRFLRYRKDNMYMLCAGAYAAHDFEISGFPRNKCLKWGYFPEFEEQTEVTLPSSSRSTHMLFSAQRLIWWKRVDLQIQLVAKLRDYDKKCRLFIAGEGPELSKLKHMAVSLGVADNVSFLGRLSPSEVQRNMAIADIFLATGNRNEGWGATVQEAMASECCVVANNAMGCASYLINQGENGVVFRDNDIDDFADKVSSVLGNVHIRKCMAKAGRELVTAGVWSASTAVDRLYNVARVMCYEDMKRVGSMFADGPLSLA